MSGKIIKSWSGALAVAVLATACGAAVTPTIPASTLAPATLAPATLAPQTPTVTAAATPAATATPEPTGPRPLRMGTLTPGQYRTNFFEPELVLTLPEGWSEFFPDEDDEMYMGSTDAELAISVADEVVDPESRSGVEAPEDLAEWLTQHPAFGTPEPIAIEIGGVGSHYVDLPGPSADTKLFHFPAGDFHIPPGVATRIYVVPLEGPDLSMVVMPPQGGSIDAAIEATASIVQSLEFSRP